MPAWDGTSSKKPLCPLMSFPFFLRWSLKKKKLQKAKKLLKVSLLSLSKDSLVNFFGKTSRISASHEEPHAVKFLSRNLIS